MRKVYSSPKTNLVYFAKSVLEANNIESVILREQLAGVVGGIAPLDAWPELWVHDSERLEEARHLLEASMVKSETLEKPWQCPGCGEMLEVQFMQCLRFDTEFGYSEC